MAAILLRFPYNEAPRLSSMWTAPVLYLYSCLNPLIAIFYNLASLFPMLLMAISPQRVTFLILAYFSVSVKSQLPHNDQKTLEVCAFVIKKV